VHSYSAQTRNNVCSCIFMGSRNIMYVTVTSIWWYKQAHIPDLCMLPEALPYLVTPQAVEEDSNSLNWLPHWAPCSITQALEFLTPPYKGHKRVMSYVLRVMEMYPPEEVTFFMPQLVQSLRYDHGVRISCSHLLQILILSACV
jgi:hypothetical protein